MLRSWSIPMFRVFGIRLELHLTFVIILVYAAWMGFDVDKTPGALWSLLLIVGLFACVVLHELGHSLTARKFGIKTTRILLLPIGGMAQMQSIPERPWREFFIVAAGPAVNFVLAPVLFGLAMIPGGLPQTEPELMRLLNTYSVTAFLVSMAAFNLIMGVFNLIPVFPMDGGRILRSLLALRLPYLKATRIAVWISRPIAVAGILYAVLYENNWLLALLFGFILFAGNAEFRMVEHREIFRRIRIEDLTTREFLSTPGTESAGDALRALEEDGMPLLVIVNAGQPVAFVRQPELRQRLGRGEPDAPVIQYCEPIRGSLQTVWPLELIGRQLLEDPGRIYPVYEGPVFRGLVDTKTLRRRLHDLYAAQHRA